MIDPETKKYIDDIVGMQNIKMSSLISSLFEILEENKIITGDEWEKVLLKSRAVASIATIYGVENFTKGAIKRAEEDEKLK